VYRAHGGAAVVLRQPWKRFGKNPIEVTGKRAAKVPRQTIESRVRLTAGAYLDAKLALSSA
jgi:hypothetical protein